MLHLLPKGGATTFRITADSITTLSMTLEIIGYIATLSITLFYCYSLERRFPDCLDAE
jgi:hypothetical protein